ncbi:MAG TPA: metal-dependent hydrolase [Telluria sp.]
MDNLSHMVAGLAAGELLHRVLPREGDPERHATRRRLLLFSCAAGNTVPDLDLVLTQLLPAPLGYLLHHRGHTHTLLYAIPQAIVLLLATLIAWPSARRLVGASQPARYGALIAVATGFLLHLSMDFLNSYGIHPFYPFDARWFYGDMVYIIEPVFWVAFGVPLAMMVRSVTLRLVLFALPCLALAYFTVRGFMLPASLAALVALGAGVAFAQHRSGPAGKGALAGIFILMLVFVALQGATSSFGRSVVTQELHRAQPADRVVDVAMSSFPANPLCWSWVSVQANEAAGTFTVRRGVAGLFPSLLGAAQCPPALMARGGAADDSAASHGEAVMVLNSREGSLPALRRMHRADCHLRAWLRFVRAPALGAAAGWDMRYGAGPDGNFSTIYFRDFSGQPCPQGVPEWGFPRADLLLPQ